MKACFRTTFHFLARWRLQIFELSVALFEEAALRVVQYQSPSRIVFKAARPGFPACRFRRLKHRGLVSLLPRSFWPLSNSFLLFYLEKLRGDGERMFPELGDYLASQISGEHQRQ